MRWQFRILGRPAGPWRASRMAAWQDAAQARLTTVDEQGRDYLIVPADIACDFFGRIEQED